MSQLSEQEINRRKSLDELRSLGIDPYPADKFDTNASAKDILENYEKNKIHYKTISIAGRIMRKRIMGKASFCELQDTTGRIQIYITREDISEGDDFTNYNTIFKN
jgi:lysyl-tRNA synthetase class 2